MAKTILTRFLFLLTLTAVLAFSSTAFAGHGHSNHSNHSGNYYYGHYLSWHNARLGMITRATGTTTHQAINGTETISTTFLPTTTGIEPATIIGKREHRVRCIREV